jgi:hypothetical protein
LTKRTETTMITHDPRWSLPRGNTLVPSRRQATFLIADFAQSAAPSLAGIVADLCDCSSGASGLAQAYAIGVRTCIVPQ